MNEQNDFFNESINEAPVVESQEFQIEVGDRVRLNENFNNLKASCLLEVIDILKSGKIKVRMVYDHSTHILDRSQIEDI